MAIIRLLFQLIIPYFSEGTASTKAPKLKITYRGKSAFPDVTPSLTILPVTYKKSHQWQLSSLTLATR
jgi:hypothetical protein